MSLFTPRRATFLLVPFVVTAALAQSASRDPQVVLETLAGERQTLPLKGFAVDDLAQLEASFVRFEGLERRIGLEKPIADRARVRLVTGDELSGWIRGGDEDALELELAGGVAVSLSIEEVQELVFPARLPGDGSAVPAAPDEGDRLLRARLGSVDQIDGIVASFSQRGVLFESSLGERMFPWEEVAALFIEMLGEARAVPDTGSGVPAIVDLVGQSRLRGRIDRLDERGATFLTASGARLELAAHQILEISLRGDRYAFLSELPMQDSGTSSPFGDELGMVWPARIDRALNGEPLRAGLRTWLRGISVHAPSRLVYALDGGWSRLRCYVAIDDQVLERGGHRGSVVFRILVDGEERFASPVVRGGDEPLAVPDIALQGAKELVLEVDPATDQFIADRADWLRPILLR